MNFDKLTITYPGCSASEQEILEEYWLCNSEGEFSTKIKDLRERIGLKQKDLDALVKSKSLLVWNFGNCSCGNEIAYRILRRNNLTACIKDRGAVEDIWTSSVSTHFGKCGTCRMAEQDRFYQKNTTRPFDSSDGFEKMTELNRVTIERRIRSLSPYELKLLYVIYSIQDFTLIKASNSVFPVKFGEHKTFVWRTFFKFIRLKLVSADMENSYIKSMHFDSVVESTLENMLGEISSLVNEIDLEITLIRVAEESRLKYFTILEPETDIVLKAGHKYEFVANVTSDKNILLRAINMGTVESIDFSETSYINPTQ